MDANPPSASSSSPSRSSNSRFKTLPILHPHEVELRVNVKELSRPIAPEKFRSKTQSVGGFVFGLLVFPQGTKSAPEHARKNRGDDDDKNPKKGEEGAKKQRWISAFVEARPSEDYPSSWCFSDVQFLVSLINYEEVGRSIVKHDKHTFSPTESSDGKAIDRGWHDFVSCDEQTLRESGFVDADDHVCFRASVYLAGGPMKVTTSKTKRYLELQKIDGPTYLNSMVQTLFHLGVLRNLIYGEATTYTGTLGYGRKGLTTDMAHWKSGSEALEALRDVCYKLQLRTSQVVSCKNFPRVEGHSLDTWFTAFYHHLLCDMIPEQSESSIKRKSKVPTLNRAEQLRDLLEFDVLWAGRDHKGKMMELAYRGPLFSLLIRGFSDLETCLGHYFFDKRALNSGDGTCMARRVIRSLPPILMWHLKRGEYDPEGIPDTYFEFPRRIDMARYVDRHDDADLNYVLYAVVVEVEPCVGNERRYYTFLRPEMEGDKGQWYRFDDGPVNSVHAVSNATAMDASLGGEEWLCVNYLYGPGNVLTRPKSSRACLLCYIREVETAQLLKEPRLPKKKSVEHIGRPHSPPSAADEIANMRAESLIEELEQQELREQKKKQQKQKKKQKEKEKRKTQDKESMGSQLENAFGESISQSDSEPDRVNTSVVTDISAASKKSDVLDGKKRKQLSTPSAAFSETQRKNGTGTQAKRKEQPATPSTGSALPDAETLGTDKRGTENSLPVLTKKERKKKAALEAEATKSHPSTPAVGSTTGSGNEINGVENSQNGDDKKCLLKATSVPSGPDLRASRDVPAPKSLPLAKQKAPEWSKQTKATRDCVAKAMSEATASASSASRNTNSWIQKDGKSSPPRTLNAVNLPKAKMTPSVPHALPKKNDNLDVSQPPAKSAPSAIPKMPLPPGAQAKPDLTRVKASNVHAKAPISGKAPGQVHTTDSMPNGPKNAQEPKMLPHPSCSSSAEPGGWYPQQLLVDDPSSMVQFECMVCHRIVRNPVVLECAHLFCRSCLENGNCPTCGVSYESPVCLAQTRGGALALLHRVYSGLKLRCLYHPDMRDQGWDELKKTTMNCDWRGFLQDYARHIDACPAHAAHRLPMSELGEMQLSTDWSSDVASPPINVTAGSVFHISSFDESQQWAYAFAGSASGRLVGWLPRNRLARKVYQVTYPYSAAGASGEKECPNSEFISMELGREVVVYHRQGNGWVYGATASSDGMVDKIGWFPERCIA